MANSLDDIGVEGGFNPTGKPARPSDTLGKMAESIGRREVLQSQPPRLLAYTFHMQISDKHRSERRSRVTFELQPMGSVVTHDDFQAESATLETTRHGWPAIVLSLKSLLETGSPLPFQGLGFGPS
jgi:uncharacterized protein YndB with AHSA1/START domain